MIEKQREKEFLFELELLYHNYNLVVSSTLDGEPTLMDVDSIDIDCTTKQIESFINMLRVETLEDVR